ncbi:probable palmitoyltransferase ZDHHC24 [Plodia interpunctella]|uniref:probable palmitoyltransferase ZDHHC24 n=1 Tax=Plodia interpunctella TaxID=58824 RepID=UPI0023678017|nr:probable palmitoyltransferase ZDHHC24 [Plodia interpunctella]
MGFWLTFEKVQCWVIVFLTPTVFLVEMAVVRPDIVARYSMGSFKHALHIVLSTFSFVNVAGNMIMVIFTDTSVKRGNTQGIYCEVCKLKRPPDAWHCKTCDICIERRDHHCFFLHRCIGRQNHRYYILYLFHMAVSMLYSGYYNYLYLSAMFDNYGFLLAICRMLNPMVRMFVKHDCLGLQDTYTIFFLANVGLFVWSAALCHYHLRNVIRGLTWHESMKKKFFYKGSRLADEYWKENLISVFGTRWYWAIIWPFAKSPLQGNFKSSLKIA